MWRNYDSWGNPLEPRNPQAVPLPPAPVERSYAWEQIKFPDFEKWNEQKAYEKATRDMGGKTRNPRAGAPKVKGNLKQDFRAHLETEFYELSSDDED